MTDAAGSMLRALDAGVVDAPLSVLSEVWDAYRNERDAGAAPFAACVLVASQVDRLGFAFAVGYPAALERMVDGIALPSALCVTEVKGNSPRVIETALVQAGDGYTLAGTKSFVTYGSYAENLIVAAKVGDKADGRPDLAVVKIPSNRKGIVLQDLPDTPFVPEVPHTSVRFENVEVLASERLPGDGYMNYVKPFRTIEDIHVAGATLGYALGLARRASAAPEVVSGIAADLLALDRLRALPPLEPWVHIALHGVYQRVGELVAGPAFAALLSRVARDEAARWERDRALLHVASKAREARFNRALEHV